MPRLRAISSKLALLRLEILVVEVRSGISANLHCATGGSMALNGLWKGLLGKRGARRLPAEQPTANINPGFWVSLPVRECLPCSSRRVAERRGCEGVGVDKIFHSNSLR
jgi:hypothetical protein